MTAIESVAYIAAELKRLDAQASALSLKLGEKNTEIQELTCAESIRTEQRDRAEALLDEQRRELACLRDSGSGRRNLLRGEIDRLNAVIRELKEGREITNLKAELSRRATKIEELKEKNADIYSAGCDVADALREEVACLNRESERKGESITRLECVIARALEERSRLGVEVIGRVRDTNKCARELLLKRDKEITNLKAELSRRATKIEELRKRCSDREHLSY